MSGDKRQPWLKWYPADWRADPRLRMCSFAARGLWADLISLMHEAQPYGHLLVNGAPPTPRQLANLFGGSEREIGGLLAELDGAGVFSRAENGSIYSRRMVRDNQRAEEGRAWVNKRYTLKVGVEKPTSDPTSDPTRGPSTQKLDTRNQKPERKKEGEVAASPLAPDDPFAIPAFLKTRTPATDDLNQALQAFNAVAERHGLPVAQMLTETRKAKLKARLEECGGLDGWGAALGKLESSAFLLGRNDKNWRADFDFLLRQSSFAKLMEGSYDGSGKRGNSDSIGALLEDGFLNSEMAGDAGAADSGKNERRRSEGPDHGLRVVAD